MSFESITRAYLQNLEQLFHSAQSSNEATPELSYRPALDSYFRNIGAIINSDRIELIFEPKNQFRAGRPDWRAYDKANFGVYGFIEAKGLDTTELTDPLKFTKQVSRYLELGQNLVLTDGIDFIFYLKSENWKPKSISLIEKPIQSNDWHALTFDPRIETAFRNFFSSPESRQCTEEQLVSEIAIRAARLSSNIHDLVDLDPKSAFNEQEKNTIEKLFALKTYLQTNHDPSLAESQPFSDFVAQVLCFGLLYSHRSNITSGLSPLELYGSIHQYWIDGIAGTVTPLRPFQELVLQLRHDLEPKDGNETALSVWYDDCRHLLSYVELTDKQRDAPDFHKLYERFLEKFDSKTRFDFGTFYTPKVLASFTVSIVDQIAKDIFGGSAFDSENKIIDPCCGTGTFIEEILEKLTDDETPTIIGFEILPAPYALAHYRLSLLENHKGKIQSKVHILLTNTLSDLLDSAENTSEEELNLLQKEQAEARMHASPPIIAVIGNPPSSDSTKAPHQLAEIYSKISALIDDFRPPQALRTTRQNTQKQLRNDFMRFLRWSADRACRSPRGILALVLPESFLEHGSYRYARKWLLDNFSHIWALDIDVDQRSGAVSSGLFNTLQGRALLVAARDTIGKNTSTSFIRYGSINSLSLQKKKDALQSAIAESSFSLLFPETVQVDFLHRFRPSDTYDETLWSKAWPIYSSSSNSDLQDGEHSIFVRHSSALKLAATSLLVHSDKSMLGRRTKDLGNSTIELQKLINDWFSGQSKPPQPSKLNVLKPSLKKAASTNKFSSYAHRPFVNLWAVLDEEVLGALTTMPGGGARPRPEVRKAFSAADNLAFAIAPSRRDIGDDLHRFTSFCWGIPDNDLCSRGNAQVVCKLFPDYKPARGDWASEPRSNFDLSLLSLLPKTGEFSKEDALVYYSYAILCASTYLDAFSGALFSTAAADTIPRIPISNNDQIFQKITSCGQRLAELENPNVAVILPKERGTLLTAFVQTDELKLRKLIREIQSNGSIKIKLIDPTGKVIFTTDELPNEIANFKVSGYLVIDEWVKWFSNRYSRIPFRTDTLKTFLELITRIESQVTVLSELNEYVDDLLDSPESWIAPQSENGPGSFT